MLDHLNETLGGNVGAMLRCCGKVSDMIAEPEEFKRRNKTAIDEINKTNADVIVTVCPSCYKVYEQTIGKKVISYWDLMREKIGIPEKQKGIGQKSDVVFNVHDSCVTRDVESHPESIRWILDQLRYKYQRIECEGKRIRCCEVGGMVCSSNPEMYERVYTRRANDFSSDHVISYCGSCRGTMEAVGKDSLHILDLLFGDTYYEDDANYNRTTTNDELWDNRLETKDIFSNYDL